MAGRYTFSEFQTYLKLQFGNNTDLEASTDYYALWTNQAYLQLTTQDKFWNLRYSFYFPELETSSTASTTDGVGYISVPSDALIVREVYDTTNNRRLSNIPLKTYVAYTDRADTAKESKPTQWTRQGTRIYLYPTPDASTYTIQIYYRKVPAQLSGNNDTTAIGPQWDDAILMLAAYRGQIWIGDYEKAKVSKQDFLDLAAGVLTLYGIEERAKDELMHIDYLYKDRY